MYNKLFFKILDSSVWLEDYPTRLIWTTFMAAMDQDGFCAFATPVNLASRARVTLQETITALRVLEAPDITSSDPDNDGRRVERVPGGWMVLNAVKYRNQVTAEEIRKQNRERVARHREKKRLSDNVTQKSLQNDECNGSVMQSGAVALAREETTLPDNAHETNPASVPPVRREAFRDAAQEARELHARLSCNGVTHVTQPSNPDLHDLVLKIACAYPKSVQASLKPADVPRYLVDAVLDALSAEEQATGGTAGTVPSSVVAESLLTRVEGFATLVPRDQWRYMPKADKFFRERGYRADPGDFTRSNGNDDNAAGKQRADSKRGTAGRSRLTAAEVGDRNDETVREFLANNGAAADSRRPGDLGSILDEKPRGDVPHRAHTLDDLNLRGESGAAVSGTGDPSLQPGSGRMQVLPDNRRATRAEW